LSPVDPEERALTSERNRLVRQSIEALDHDMRVALVLRDVNGMAYEEIAAVVKVPLGTVKSRIARAREQVQERLRVYPELFHLPSVSEESHEQ
jgi:RNA polymerase sigma-70 factor (ECF subfamily)